ncbi:MAG: uridine kinase [Litorilinea sp.]|nr:MAG: uridine kinase [Litorilinea sp.]
MEFTRFITQWDALVAAIRQARLAVSHRDSRPLVVALDGGSGAGKSTLAGRLRRELDLALIPLDDFFSGHIPDACWDTFTVAEKLERVFHWERLRRQVLVPLLAGQEAVWHPFDFAGGLRPDGTYGLAQTPRRCPPAEIIVVEGAYSAGPALADLVALAILVDVPVAERHARLARREEAGFLRQWHARWDALEHYYFTQVRPRDSFDLVVNNSGEGPWISK